MNHLSSDSSIIGILVGLLSIKFSCLKLYFSCPAILFFSKNLNVASRAVEFYIVSHDLYWLESIDEKRSASFYQNFDNFRKKYVLLKIMYRENKVVIISALSPFSHSIIFTRTLNFYRWKTSTKILSVQRRKNQYCTDEISTIGSIWITKGPWILCTEANHSITMCFNLSTLSTKCIRILKSFSHDIK